MCAAASTPELTLSSLCVACKSIFDGSTLKNENAEVEHHGLEALATRAARGCHLCLTVYMSIDPEVYKSFQRPTTNGHGQTHHVDETLGFACVGPIARDQARLKFRYVRTKTEGSNGCTDGSPQEDVKGKGRIDTTTATPSMNSSKLSLPLSVGSDKDGEAVPVVVELILMNPRCQCLFHIPRLGALMALY